jgi:hypothetical protein
MTRCQPIVTAYYGARVVALHTRLRLPACSLPMRKDTALTTPSQERRAPGDEGKRYGVIWDLSAGHRKIGTVRGQVINVSSSGLLIRVPAEYDIGNIIEVEMSPAVGVFVRAIVQIVRLHAQSSASYEYGGVIVRHTDETRTFFNEALLELRRKEMRSDFGREQLTARPAKKPPT